MATHSGSEFKRICVIQATVLFVGNIAVFDGTLGILIDSIHMSLPSLTNRGDDCVLTVRTLQIDL